MRAHIFSWSPLIRDLPRSHLIWVPFEPKLPPKNKNKTLSSATADWSGDYWSNCISSGVLSLVSTVKAPTLHINYCFNQIWQMLRPTPSQLAIHLKKNTPSPTFQMEFSWPGSSSLEMTLTQMTSPQPKTLSCMRHHYPGHYNLRPSNTHGLFLIRHNLDLDSFASLPL